MKQGKYGQFVCHRQPPAITTKPAQEEEEEGSNHSQAATLQTGTGQ
jgi:hypothetical protein